MKYLAEKVLGVENKKNQLFEKSELRVAFFLQNLSAGGNKLV